MEGGRCLKGKNEQLSFTEDRATIWKEHMKKNHEENNGDHIVETDVVEGPVEKVTTRKLRKQYKR